MVTKGALEKRLAELEAKMAPKRIETLADFVLFIANRREGEEWPPLSPEMEDLFDRSAEGAERHDEDGVGSSS